MVMKILLYTDHSKTSANLAAISASNHWRYSAHHCYDFLTVRREWNEVLKNMNEPLYKYLPLYDAVMVFGSDVLFTNFDIGIENIYKPGDNIILAEEPKGWPSKVNLGVIIYCNTTATFDFLHKIDQEHDNWVNLRLISQEWITNNLDLPVIKNALRVVPTRTMNSTYGHTKACWQPGDWLVHFYGRGQDTKPDVMREFLMKYPNLK
jgi:hypothetical protein